MVYHLHFIFQMLNSDFLTKMKRTFNFCYLLADHEKKTTKEICAPNKKVS